MTRSIQRLWLCLASVNLISLVRVSIAESHCFGCGRATTCENLCEAAQEQCLGSWQAATGDGEPEMCLLSYPTAKVLQDWTPSTGRVVSSNVTYRIHKDVLSDLVYRYNQIKRLKAQGVLSVSSGLRPAEDQLLRLAVGLTFPRISLMMRLLWGATFPPQTICCHQECHWEEMLRERTLPSLRSLLARSVAAHEQSAGAPRTCSTRPFSAFLGESHGLMSRMWSSLELSGWRVLPWARQWVGRLSWRHVAHVAWWAVAPSMMVAMDGIQVSSDQPVLALAIGCVAFAFLLADWHSIGLSVSDPTLSPSDRLICHLGSALIGTVFTATVTALTIGLGLPILDPPAATIWLWVMIIGYPALGMAAMLAAKRWHHMQREPDRAWVRWEVHRVRQHGNTTDGVHGHAAGTAAEQTQGTTLPRTTSTETDLLLETLEALLFPANWAEQQERMQRMVQRAADGQFPQRSGRSEGGRRGGAERPPLATRTGSVGGASGLQVHVTLTPERLVLEEGMGEGSSGPVSEMGAGTGASGSGANTPPRQPLIAVGDEGAVSGGEAGHFRARQAAAQAAFAAIHWPPPLDLPGWLDDATSIPHAFRCPITLCVMREPTQASSGVTYERSALLQWLSKHRVDPVTHVPIKRHRLTPNLNLRHMIEEWVTKQVEENASSHPKA